MRRFFLALLRLTIIVMGAMMLGFSLYVAYVLLTAVILHMGAG